MNARPRSERLIVDPQPNASGGRTNLTRARGQRTREIILEEAAALFAVHGYQGTSLRDISERVGISHPGMLHHFSHKDALLVAVLERVSASFKRLIDDFAAVAQDPEALSEWGAIRQYQSLMFAVVRAEALEPSHPARAVVKDMQTMAEEQFAAVFTQYQEKGWLVEGVSPEWCARSMVAIWTGAFMREGLFHDELCESDIAVFARLIIKPLREHAPKNVKSAEPAFAA